MQTTFTAASTLAPTPSPARQALRQARRRNRELTEGRIAAKIERANSLLEGAGDWTSSIYQMLDRFSSWQADFGGQQFAGLGFGGFASTLADRQWGKNFPVYQTEVDLQTLRFASRLLLATNGYAIGMLEGITSYVIADGFTQEVKPKAGHEDDVPDVILDKLNEVLDDFRIRNDWHGGEQPGLEEELFQRGEEDGEFYGCLYEDDAACTWVNTVEPEQNTAPYAGMEWLFGILTDPNNQRPIKYWLRGMNTTGEGDEYDAEQVIHYKLNVKRQMKRGIPSFSFGVADTLRLSDNLRRSLGTGAGIQAAIAGVRQWENATQQQVQGFQAAFQDYTMPAPPGSSGPTASAKIYSPGGIEDIPKGMQWVNPPNATNAPAHIQILQACLRGATARWNAPEWIGSGDAGNNGFAGALVVDAPFTKRVIRTQKRIEMIEKRIFTWALNCRCERQGIITAVKKDGTVVSIPWETLKKLVEVVVTAPSVEVRNKLEEAQANQIRVAGGWKSQQTVQAEENLDSERELANILEWREQTGGPGLGLEMPGDPNAPKPSPGGNSGEQRDANSDKTPKPPAFTESKHIAVKDAAGVVHLLELAGEAGFTGTADNGHHYVNGHQVSKEQAAAHASKSKPAETAPSNIPADHAKAQQGATEAIGKLDAELGEHVKEGGKFHELSVKVAAKVVSAVRGLIQSEAPIWATETCDLWMFENAMNQSGGAGSVMAVKIAGFVACKAYMVARGLLGGKTKTQESAEPAQQEGDVHALAEQLHDTMREIASVAGFGVPSIPELVKRLEKARTA